jgi:YHS domain-containing protein
MRTRLLLSFALLLAVLASTAQAGTPVFQDAAGIAIKGYDPVAYFMDGKPVAGKAEITHSWQGATWRFASTEHRDAFVKEPARYAPQYGGYCAFGVAKGAKYPIDPSAFKVVDGKLYLNYDASVQKDWQKDIPGLIAKANQNWPTLETK